MKALMKKAGLKDIISNKMKALNAHAKATDAALDGKGPNPWLKKPKPPIK